MLEVNPITKTKFKVTEEGRKFIGLYEDMIRMTRNVINNLSSVIVPTREMSSIIVLSFASPFFYFFYFPLY